MKLPSRPGPKRPSALVAGLCGLFTVANLASGEIWRLTGAPVATGESSWVWRAVACSTDGTKLAAAGRTGRNCSLGYCRYFDIASPIYTSADSGATWTQTSSPTNVWSALASSADGANLVATCESGIYTSMNSGATWTRSRAPTNGWSSVASSADGAALVAAASGPPFGDGLIYTSADSGANWTQTSAPSNPWSSVASSADGAKLVAAWGGTDTNGIPIVGLIYTSANSGSTWTRTSAPSSSWSSVASSADGTKLAAAASFDYVNPGGIYTSTDSGATWTQSSTLTNLQSFVAVASSADGTTLAAAGAAYDYGFFGGPATALTVCRSTNSGATWTSTISPLAGGTSVACSAEGSFMVAAGFGIYTWPYSGPWRLERDPSVPSNSLSCAASSADGAKLARRRAKSMTPTECPSAARSTPRRISAPRGRREAHLPTFGPLLPLPLRQMEQNWWQRAQVAFTLRRTPAPRGRKPAHPPSVGTLLPLRRMAGSWSRLPGTAFTPPQIPERLGGRPAHPPTALGHPSASQGMGPNWQQHHPTIPALLLAAFIPRPILAPRGPPPARRGITGFRSLHRRMEPNWWRRLGVLLLVTA